MVLLFYVDDCIILSPSKDKFMMFTLPYRRILIFSMMGNTNKHIVKIYIKGYFYIIRLLSILISQKKLKKRIISLSFVHFHVNDFKSRLMAIFFRFPWIVNYRIIEIRNLISQLSK